MRLARRVTLFIRGTKMAPKYQKSHNNQSALPLPLFDWADRNNRRRRPFAVAHMQRLYNVTPSVARLYAEVAGLSVEERT
jgi:hypothetical protein